MLQKFRWVFTEPTLRTFLALSPADAWPDRRRFLTELIQARGSVHAGHHSRYHCFFSQAAWDLDALGYAVATSLLATLAPKGLVCLAVADTLWRKRGLSLFGAGMHHDPLISSRAKALVSWGHDGVVLCLLVRCPRAPTAGWALLPLAQLYRNCQGLPKAAKAIGRRPTPTTARAPNWPGG